jgi:predicted kinase
LLVVGLMGTGKSTLALALHREVGWTIFSSDMTRKRLARLDPARPQASACGQGMYSQAWTARTYQALFSDAGAALADGRSVLFDASFIRLLIARPLLAQPQHMEHRSFSLNASARERSRSRGLHSTGSCAQRAARD